MTQRLSPMIVQGVVGYKQTYLTLKTQSLLQDDHNEKCVENKSACSFGEYNARKFAYFVFFRHNSKTTLN